MAAYISLSVSESGTNVSNNTSVISVSLYYHGNGVSWANGGCSGYITIDGTQYSFSGKTITKSTSSQFIASASKTVTHNSDGKKSVGVTGYLYTPTSSAGTMTTSTTYTCSTIPRVSDLSLNKSSVPADGSSTITATGTKKSSSFTDTITVKFGSKSASMTSGSAFTIPEAWCDELPNATSGTATVTLTTKNGSTTIGSTSKTFTVTVPESVLPKIESVGMSEGTTAVTSAFSGTWVKLLSTAKFSININDEDMHNSTITKYSTTFDGVTYSGSSFTSNAIKTAGSLTATVTVTDSRGRTASTTKTITVIDYEYPSITSVSCPTSGTTITVTVKGKVAPVTVSGSNKNTKALTVKYKKASASSWTSKTVTLSSYDFSSSGVSTSITGIDSTVTYDIMATLTDKISSTSMQTSTGIVALSFYPGGKGAAFFGEATREGLVMYGDILIDDDELEAAWNEVFG